MGRKIVITSGKGGVGKTTVTANLGYALAESGLRTVLIDADIGLNNLDVALKLENRIVYDLGDAVIGRCRLKQALVQVPGCTNLELLPSAKSIGDGVIKTAAFNALVNELAINCDAVIIDCPAGIDEGFQRAVLAADEAIVVTTPHISAIRDADKVLGILASYSIKSAGLAVNRIRGDMVVKGAMMSASEISQLLRTPIIAALPEDDGVTLFGTTAAGASFKTSAAYKMFADNVIGASRAIYDTEKGYRGIMGLFKRR